MPEPEFSPEELLQALTSHGVRFVLVGGFAAVIHGSPYVTFDLDITPEDSQRNLERLSRCLSDIHARIYTEVEPEGLPFAQDAASLAAVRLWNLITDFGRLDIVFEPTGTKGFKDLTQDAVRIKIEGADIDVASLADVVRSKESAGRDRDRLVLPVLRRMLEEVANREE